MLRTNIGACLVLCLVLTSQTMAVARGAQDPSGQVVLCTGTGPVTVLVDAKGQPVGQVHICPDCALGLFDTAPASPEKVERPLLHRVVAFSQDDRPSLSRDDAIVRVRGPPRPA